MAEAALIPAHGALTTRDGASPHPPAPATVQRAAFHSATPNRETEDLTGLTDLLDRSIHAAVARFTGGLSPAALTEAYLDWATHLANAPGKRLRTDRKGDARKAMRLCDYASRCCESQAQPTAACIEPLPQDRRFVARSWQQFPYNLIYQGFLLQSAMVAQRHDRNPRRVPPPRGRGRVRGPTDARYVFAVKFPLTNPEILRRTQREAGQILCDGLAQPVGRLGARRRAARNRSAPRHFVVGRERCHHSRYDRLPQSADRADPVCADDRARCGRSRS